MICTSCRVLFVW